jgi:phenylpyruvate tautomerase PptA (4-oxalocrotonate tautomerase family)
MKYAPVIFTGARRMPNIFVTIPRNTFDNAARADLTRRLCEAAATAEQIPDDPRKRATCWIIFNEVDAEAFTCGAKDVSAAMIPCIAISYVPAGVLDKERRARFIELAHAAFQQSLPTGDKRLCVTSVMVRDVDDGTWGANGALWHLSDFAKASGYTHLQHLI